MISRAEPTATSVIPVTKMHLYSFLSIMRFFLEFKILRSCLRNGTSSILVGTLDSLVLSSCSSSLFGRTVRFLNCCLLCSSFAIFDCLPKGIFSGPTTCDGWFPRNALWITLMLKYDTWLNEHAKHNAIRPWAILVVSKCTNYWFYYTCWSPIFNDVFGRH